MKNNKFLRKICRFLLRILHDWLGKYLENEVGSLGFNSIHNALLCDGKVDIKEI